MLGSIRELSTVRPCEGVRGGAGYASPNASSRRAWPDVTPCHVAPQAKPPHVFPAATDHRLMGWRCEVEIERKWRVLEMFLRGHVNGVRVHLVAV